MKVSIKKNYGLYTAPHIEQYRFNPSSSIAQTSPAGDLVTDSDPMDDNRG